MGPHVKCMCTMDAIKFKNKVKITKVTYSTYSTLVYLNSGIGSGSGVNAAKICEDRR